MCDYSLEQVESRKGVAGEKLVTARIGDHTIGFVSPSTPGVAVCLAPGTKLLVETPRDFQQNYGILPIAPATFAKKDLKPGENGWRDGIKFDSLPKMLVLLQDFEPGTVVTVEIIPAEKPERVVDRRQHEFA